MECLRGPDSLFGAWKCALIRTVVKVLRKRGGIAGDHRGGAEGIAGHGPVGRTRMGGHGLNHMVIGAARETHPLVGTGAVAGAIPLLGVAGSGPVASCRPAAEIRCAPYPKGSQPEYGAHRCEL